MLVAAAVCPSPPLLVPEVAQGAAPELTEVRDACADALGLLAAARPDLLVVVGPVTDEARRGEYGQGSQGSFEGFGVPLTVTLGADGGPARHPRGPMPPSLAVAAWLLGRNSWSPASVTAHAVPQLAPPADCFALGGQVAHSAERVALLAMGEGCATRTHKAPGYYDERAQGFDSALAQALGGADTAALRALDQDLAAELQVSGRSCWQVLAEAAEPAGLRGTLLHDSAPYGVGYMVAAWT